MRILFLSAWCPLPADNGAKLRIAALLRGLARRHTVDLLSFAPEPPDAASLRELQTICHELELIPETPFAGRPVGRLAGLFSGQPRSMLANHSPTMAAAVRRRAAQGYDLVVASQLHMAPYALEADCPRVLEEIELGILRDQMRQTSLVQRLRSGLTWWRTTSYLRRILQQFAGATVVSQAEYDLLQPIAPASLPLAIVPNGVDVAGSVVADAIPVPDTLIYPGALSYAANYDAVSFFVTEVLPRLRAVRPKVRLLVTGRATPEQQAQLAADGVVFTGYVADIRRAVAEAWAEVVPLRIGGGTRLKVLEALAIGTPVIATNKGIEGLAVQPERDLLLADSAEAFVAQTLRLLESPELRQELIRQGRQAVIRYDWQASTATLEALVEQIVPSPVHTYGPRSVSSYESLHH